MYISMKRVMQCLFALGLLLILAGLAQEVRLKYAQAMREDAPLPVSPPPVVNPAPVVRVPLPEATVIPSEPPAIVPGDEPGPKPKAKPKTKPKTKSKIKRMPVPASKPKVLKLDKPLPGVPLPPKPAAPVVAPAQPRKGDFDPKILNKAMPRPVQAPSDIELPKVVAEDGQWIGSQSGMTEPFQTVFRNTGDWSAFWEKAIAPYSRALRQAPVIDFSKDMVVGVFMGKEPLAGYQIRIVKTATQMEGQESVLVVRYKNIDRFLGIFAPQFDVQPFHLLRLHSFPGKVEFIQVKDEKP
jgi:hypothetical protein